jgi:serine/threonine-protein phosphatase 5
MSGAEGNENPEVKVTAVKSHHVSEETKAKAEEFKVKGNEALQQFKYTTAVELYSAAIDLFPTAIYYANRAAANMKTESYGLAIDDASAAIELEPGYVKGLLNANGFTQCEILSYYYSLLPTRIS